MISEILRLGVKYHEMRIDETKEIYCIDHPYIASLHTDQDVKTLLLNRGFAHFVKVNVENQKALERLYRIIRYTSYKIIQVDGQRFTLEGGN